MTRLPAAISHGKEALLAACVLAALPTVLDRIALFQSWTGLVSYLGLLTLLSAALMAAAYIPAALLRWATALLLSASAYFLFVFERVTTQFLSYDAFINMMNSAAFLDDALHHNRVAFSAALAPALLLLVAIGMSPRMRLPLPAWLVAAGPWIGAGLLAGILFLRGGEGARGQPASFTPIAYLALAGYEEATGQIGPRQPVRLPRIRAPRSRAIVLVVDESIAGQYLDINSPFGVPTPLSRDWPGVAIHNFGLAASITNCSVGTNLTLRFGGTRDDYQRINATMPSIFAYARKAGLRTVYIDAQRTGGALQNRMDAEERALIDRFIQFDAMPVLRRDMAVAQALREELADPEPKFVLVNKVGAHFPVHDKYPDAFMRYRPALPRGRFADVVDTRSREGFGGSPAEWAQYRNAYRNTLLWNVGAFFDELLGKGDLSGATIVYTSDHGQNLHERGNPGLATHCTVYPEREEGVVPLVVIEGGAGSGLDWRGSLPDNHNRSSHYMVFPTLLNLMGYDPAAIRPVYGAGMDQPARDPATFNGLFNARLKREPVWLPIDPDNIAQPPRADHR